MREIKFRGQTRKYGEKVNMAGDKLPSKWVYGGIFPCNGEFSIIYGGETEKDLDKFRVYTSTVGQFTGLYDKNGKEIYEGDVVKFTNDVEEIYHEEIGVCEFDSSECNFVLHRTVANPRNYPVPKTTHTIYLINNEDYDCDYEIIGNVWEDGGTIDSQ